MRQMSDDVQPGLLVLHGNRTELLGEAVFDWLARQPLRPLEQEIFLVQSDGVAEWLKMALASQVSVITPFDGPLIEFGDGQQSHRSA